AALKTLEREERDIVVLRYYEGRSLTDISRLTGVSYGMVKVKHKRALRALRTLLE
ncbi:MAG: RNA polymerase sigma factor, partial [Oscillibacter sp.]|nr:RNA polymerase sigma factor [Oscillibacter sp.]